MFMFFHALALALGLFGGFGGGFTHFGGGAGIGAPMLGPTDGGGSMPGPGNGGLPGTGGH
ncbi:MAG TPA: hypothetical protein VMT95_05990 [Candidatus Binatia bacterium]|nr:hypothetical protein [Candidatus Binatia bacterium]